MGSGSSLSDLAWELNHLRNAKSAAAARGYAGSIEAGCTMIADAVKTYVSVLHYETTLTSSKEVILQSNVIPYILTTILNKQFNKITKNSQVSATVLDGISPKFIRELST
ncbi:hypothetical protein [Rickettsia canadensis]|uniref:Uncharacterized protein n=1 Tax=Rickettsia canadensis str. CA410 TaxID=1105107 RepID=A0ABM5MT29_RICCA|nr:hypothetical protein [Rickettsia canadensis]AFB21386.1 hypothetical protein RCA_04145 [Rickettsia canadensis str. CA410]